ncbi:MAG: hypothetical protein JKY56_12150, partial [Kofleriaceae bacterium]|nr:hypothetical protein [Kofleriaceae bacterium]
MTDLRSFLCAAVLVLGASSTGCGDDDAAKGASGKGGKTNTADDLAAEKKAVSVRSSMRSFRPLLNEVLRAEVSIAGIAID